MVYVRTKDRDDAIFLLSPHHLAHHDDQSPKTGEPVGGTEGQEAEERDEGA